MSNVKIELNRAGVRELLRSGMVMTALENVGEAKLQALGEGYSMNSFVGRNRCNVEITAESPRARRENLERNTLLRAIS